MTTPQERHPEIFERKTAASSPRGRLKSVPMEAMNLSFMRCGTSSMHVAFQVLGMKSWHSTLFMGTHYGDLEMWEEASQRKFFKKGSEFGKAEFDQLFHDFQALSSDIPALAFSQELIKAYPDAKVVLVERDEAAWEQSFEKGIIQNMFSPIVWLMYYLDPFIIRPIGHCQHLCIQGWLGAYSAKDLRRTAIKSYREHNAMIKRLVPKENLLEFKLKDGWEPLCSFLGKPVPNQSFPHVNDQVWLNEKVNLLMVKALRQLMWKTLTYGSPVFVAIVFGYFYIAGTSLAS